MKNGALDDSARMRGLAQRWRNSRLTVCGILMVAASFAAFFAPAGLGMLSLIQRRKDFNTILPAPTGPYNVGTHIDYFTDETRPDQFIQGRNRTLMIQMWYPCDRRFS